MGILLELEFYILLAFIVFWIFFGKLIFKNLSKILDASIEGIKTKLNSVNDLQNQAEDILNKEREIYNNLEFELNKKLEEAKTDFKNYAEKKKAEIEASGKQLQASMLSSLDLQIYSHYRTSLDELVVKTTEVSRKVLQASITDKLTEELIEASIMKLPNYLKAHDGWK